MNHLSEAVFHVDNKQSLLSLKMFLLIKPFNKKIGQQTVL